MYIYNANFIFIIMYLIVTNCLLYIYTYFSDAIKTVFRILKCFSALESSTGCGKVYVNVL